MDLFTRQGWAFPLRTKSGKEVADLFERFFRTHKTKRLQTDEGLEFYNSSVKKVLERYGIELFSIYSPYKAAHVERLNRTVKGMLERVFTATNTKNWVRHIDDVMDVYNNRVHRSIGMPPNEASEREQEAFENQYGHIDFVNKTAKIKYPIGTRVRISKKKEPLDGVTKPTGQRKSFSSSAIVI